MTLVTPAVLLADATVVAYIRTPVPTQPKDGVTDEGSTVYYADGASRTSWTPRGCSGVPASALKPFEGQAGVALGIPDVAAVTQAAGYAAFANGGTAVVPHLVTKVVDANGWLCPAALGRRAGAPGAGRGAGDLRDAGDRPEGDGHARGAVRPRGGGKTGTTEHNRAAWFVGYVPQLSTAVVAPTRTVTPARWARAPVARAPAVIRAGCRGSRVTGRFPTTRRAQRAQRRPGRLRSSRQGAGSG